MKNILIVGAGAVGQAYGYQFAQAGNQVSFFVKEKHEQSMAEGLVLYHLNQDKKRRRPVHFRDYGVITDWHKARETHWHQIYLCISSTAFLTFDFKGLEQAIKPETIVVILQPGPDDYELACQHLPKEQLVQGMITLISYNAPLPGESVPEPGIAYWLPPMAATPFTGNPKARAAVVNTFKRANMNAAVNTNLRKMAPYATAALMVFLTALEASDWQFDQLKSNVELQEQMLQAQSQAFDAVSWQTDTPPPLWRHAIKGWVIRLLLRTAPKVVPLDLETYFQVHFTKVKDQTKLFMNTYIASAEKHDLEAADLIALNQMTDH
ncbi:MAG: 2-dehydropantoate 2-reductase N-terminal domain-containing protein [Ketobacteraceae bacterium]|nr:2-dehydropantoate 2-reductase N-terminal domain-containing protein [Ketobacteraceae bacterium]